jgi:YVTN family beta-propeller protein
MSKHYFSVAATALFFASTPLSAQAVLIAGNKSANTATLVDLATSKILATLPTGVGPHEAAASRNGKWAVVTNYGGGGVPGRSLTLIDIASRTVARTIDLGEYRAPHGVQFLPGDSLVAVTVEASNAVLLVDVASGTVRRAFETRQPGSHMVAVRADGDVGYTSNIRGNSVTEIDFKTGRTRWLAVANEPEGLGVTPDGKEVWAGSNIDGTIAIIDVATWRVAHTIAVGERPYRVSFAPDGKTALASLTSSSRVRIYDAVTRKEIATVSIEGNSAASSLARGGAQPVGVAFSSDSRYAYVACQGINAIAVIDLKTRSVIRTIPVGPGPDAVAIAEQH